MSILTVITVFGEVRACSPMDRNHKYGCAEWGRQKQSSSCLPYSSPSGKIHRRWESTAEGNELWFRCWCKQKCSSGCGSGKKPFLTWTYSEMTTLLEEFLITLMECEVKQTKLEEHVFHFSVKAKVAAQVSATIYDIFDTTKSLRNINLLSHLKPKCRQFLKTIQNF